MYPYSVMMKDVLCFLVIFSLMNTSESLARIGYFAGFDLGTSGVRLSIIEPDDGDHDGYREVYAKAIQWNGEYDNAETWIASVNFLFKSASKDLGSLDCIRSICVSGTSASVVMMNRETREITREARMYNYDVIKSAEVSKRSCAEEALNLLNKYAPEKHTARASTGSLAKLLAWSKESALEDDEILCHQSDFLSTYLMEESTVLAVKSDWHNCLKLGYDVREKRWPKWLVCCLKEIGISNPNINDGNGVIPREVFPPGKPIGIISKKVATSLGLRDDCVIVAGTTDSNAAFFAAAGTKPSFGTAVTSLGSTLAIKHLSKKFIEDSTRGVYSHRFPNFRNPDDEAWLVGGASNVGCKVLRKLNFSNEELDELSNSIDPFIDSQTSYYPLTETGERFPIANSNKEPLLEPVPESRKEYLHGILQAISDVEQQGFEVLENLGAPPISTIWTCGGGSRNTMWNTMRERRMVSKFGRSDITVRTAKNTEASYGAALLAAASFSNKN